MYLVLLIKDRNYDDKLPIVYGGNLGKIHETFSKALEQLDELRECYPHARYAIGAAEDFCDITNPAPLYTVKREFCL